MRSLSVARPLLFLGSAIMCSCIIVQPLPPEEQDPPALAPAPRATRARAFAPPPEASSPYASALAPEARTEPPADPPPTQAWPPPSPPREVPEAPAPAAPPPPGILRVTCEGFAVEEQYQYLQSECEGFPAVPVQAVSGLESLPEELRSCLLTAIPMPPAGATRADCQDHARHRLDRRLNELGWLDAEVQAVRIGGAGTWGGPPWLHIKLGGRYEIGDLQMDYFSGLDLKREDVIAEARKAIPEGAAWATSSTMEAMRQRVARMGAFEQVSVTTMNRNSNTHRVPLQITVQFIPSLARKAKGCADKDAFCPIGRSICSIDPRTGCRTKCHCEGTSLLHW